MVHGRETSKAVAGDFCAKNGFALGITLATQLGVPPPGVPNSFQENEPPTGLLPVPQIAVFQTTTQMLRASQKFVRRVIMFAIC